jgi:hypothetical protein
MNAGDRKLLSSEFGRGIAMLKVGDREGTIALLRRLRALVSGRDPDAIEPAGRFHCARLDGELTHQACVDRQVENEKQLRRRKARAQSNGNTARHRGKVPEYPTCVTGGCEQGSRIRRAIGGDVAKEDSPEGLQLRSPHPQAAAAPPPAAPLPLARRAPAPPAAPRAAP